MFLNGILEPESIRNLVKNVWNTVLKAREKHIQKRNGEYSGGERGIVDAATPRMTAQNLVNELVSVFYVWHSVVQLYRPTSVVETAAIPIDMIRDNHSSTDSVLKMLFHLEYLTEQGTYQRTLIMLEVLLKPKQESIKNIYPHFLRRYIFPFQANAQRN